MGNARRTAQPIPGQRRSVSKNSKHVQRRDSQSRSHLEDPVSLEEELLLQRYGKERTSRRNIINRGKKDGSDLGEEREIQTWGEHNIFSRDVQGNTTEHSKKTSFRDLKENKKEKRKIFFYVGRRKQEHIKRSEACNY